MKKFTVIGLGNFGFHAAKALYEDGNEVIAIDTDRAKVQAIDPFCTEAIVLNATEKEALQSLGLEEMEAVIVSTGTSISISVIICLYLHELHVKRILVKALDKDHEKILLRVGATEIIHPERDMAIRISRSLSQSNMLDFIPISSEFNLVQIEPPAEFINKSLKNLNLRARFNVNVIAVKKSSPETFVLVPLANYVIQDSDILVILGKSDDIKKLESHV
ncbi:MAG: TrkA family potassium uptake protein [Desulfocapsaceae bacterium]|nr:TrkA family potassium uptake protein [Desulfocapsaceae bacterium]